MSAAQHLDWGRDSAFGAEEARDDDLPTRTPRLRPATGRALLAPIGDVAREFGVTLRALRFYEDKGLIAPLRQGVTRLYRPEDRRRLALILDGKKLGFTLQRIRALIEEPQELVDPDTLRPEIVRALSPAEASASSKRWSASVRSWTPRSPSCAPPSAA